MKSTTKPAGDPRGWEDGELVAAVLDGRKELFSVLVERHQQPVYSYLHRLLLRDEESARDLAQTVFLKTYRNLRAVDPARPLLPWLYRIAHNEAANHLRGRSRRPEAGLEPEDWARVADPAGDTPERALAQRQEHAALHRALAALKPRLRSAVVLHYFEERSYQEIAEILQVPLGTVGTYLHRGRNALREALGEALGGALPGEPDRGPD
jgi:RNA polymerase sigma-70 factor (ECF subfamily)